MKRLRVDSSADARSMGQAGAGASAAGSLLSHGTGLTQGLLFLDHTSLSAADVTATFRQIAAAEARVAEFSAQARHAYVSRTYASAALFDTRRAEGAQECERQAAVAAHEAYRVRTAAGVDSAAASSSASDKLKEWGVGASAEVLAAVSEAAQAARASSKSSAEAGASAEAAAAMNVEGQRTADSAPQSGAEAETQPALVPTLTEGPYRGRPLHGYTSAALYLSAEHTVGYPPKKRDGWRYPPGMAAPPSSASSSSAGAGGGASWALNTSSSGLAPGDPSFMAEAREALKRPAWPDRAHLPGQGSGSGAGALSPALRATALAASYDEAAETEKTLFEMQRGAIAAAVGFGATAATVGGARTS